MNARLSRLALAGALAALVAATSPAAAEDKGNNDDKVSCRREAGTGSRLGTRICMTRAQWKERDRLNREGARRTIDNATRELAERPMNSGERSSSVGPN